MQKKSSEDNSYLNIPIKTLNSHFKKKSTTYLQDKDQWVNTGKGNNHCLFQ
jgi:hypothetical protein